MKKYSMILLILAACLFQATAQTYVYQDPSPFQIQVMDPVDSSRLGFKFVFQDISGNEAADVVIMGIDYIDTSFHHPSPVAQIRYFMAYQENTGTLTDPLFAPRTTVFESFEFERGESFWVPDLADLNGDGLMDFVVSAFVDSIQHQYLMFYIQQADGRFERSLCDDWNLNRFPPYSFFVPELTDLDVDGDLDLLLSGYYNFDFTDDNPEMTFLYAKNIGTPENPEFLGWFENPYGLNPSPDFPQMLKGGDIDLDGDTDVLSFGNSENGVLVQFYENTAGPGHKPAFAAPVDSPFGLPIPEDEADAYYFPSLTDLDGDGDLDLFIPHASDESGLFTLDYFENQTCSEDIVVINPVICAGEQYEFGGQSFSEPGEYQVVTVLLNRCKRTTLLRLIVHPLPVARVDHENSILATPLIENYTYQWFDCNTGLDIPGATEYLLDVPYSGSFAVRITNEFGCEAISDCYDVIASQVNLVSEKNLDILPNPTKGTFRVINRTGLPIQSIQIADSKGKMVLTVKATQKPLQLEGLPKGLYFVKIDLGTHAFIKKVMILP